MIEPTESLFPIQPLCQFLKNIITQTLFPAPNMFNYRQNLTWGGIFVKEGILSAPYH